MEDVGMNLSRKEILHVLAGPLIVLVATRELLHISAQDLYLETMQTHVLLQHRNHDLLMALR